MEDSGTKGNGGNQVKGLDKPSRRRFSAEYKLRILREADACSLPGQLGALLRREGLFSSHLSDWRKARALGELEALSPKTRGRKPLPVDPRDTKIAELERLLAKTTARAERAEALVELQKKLSQLLGSALEDGRP